MAVIRGSHIAERFNVGTQIPQNASVDATVAMQLLATGVPLRLLLDLAAPDGPDSEVIAATEETGQR